MISKKIFQWDENYPNIEIFKDDVKNKSLFVIEDNELIMGCICISLQIDDVYKDVKWLTPNSNNVYLHRLAIHPNFQGQGLALKLMEYAEDFTIKNGCISIRLDTFSGNPKNNKFYTLQGYTKLEKIFYRNQSDMPFHCFEKIL
jgi:ribosomal protein S18 acetylase RimI-like enzyme